MKTLCLLCLNIVSTLNLLYFVTLSCKPGRTQDSVKKCCFLDTMCSFKFSCFLTSLELGLIDISVLIDSKCCLCYTLEFMIKQGFVFPYIQIHLFQNP